MEIWWKCLLICAIAIGKDGSVLGRGATSCEWWIPEIALVRIGFRNMNRWIQA